MWLINVQGLSKKENTTFLWKFPVEMLSSFCEACIDHWTWWDLWSQKKDISKYICKGSFLTGLMEVRCPAWNVGGTISWVGFPGCIKKKQEVQQCWSVCFPSEDVVWPVFPVPMACLLHLSPRTVLSHCETKTNIFFLKLVFTFFSPLNETTKSSN